jgi:membrane protease YdiL (CAAX protease family)
MKSKLKITGEIVVLSFVSTLLIGIFTSGTLSQLENTQFGIFIAIAIGQLVGLGLLGTLYLDITYDNRFKKIHFNFKKKHILYIAGIILLVLLTNFSSQLLSEYINIQSAENNIAPYLETQENVIAFFIVSVIIVGPLEEYFYRGILQERLKDTFTSMISIFLTSIVFAITHLGSMNGSEPVGYLLYLATLFLGAAIFGYSYEETQNLAIPMLAHGLYNGILAVSLLGSVGLI